MRIIPAIDLQDGKCVRLFQGDFDQTTEYSSNPAEIAARFSKLKVRDLHVVDLDGARSGTQHNRSSVEQIIALSHLDVQLGGGIRSRETVADWLSLGIARCVVGSTAIKQPHEVRDWFDEFGGDRIVLALDIKLAEDSTPMLTTDGWTQASEMTLWDAIETFQSSGLRHVLCTDVSRDGALAGPNIDLYFEIMRRYPDLQLQASGGVRDIADLEALRDAGMPAAITGRAMLDGRITAQEVAAFQQNG
ncbi:MAG: 1-(5-phosphoribosyl)-5-[(5-phosphoribosylamino)methylideneamino]imidazole-4-carboxamide isomerase [Woeseiaceae bacterium]